MARRIGASRANHSRLKPRVHQYPAVVERRSAHHHRDPEPSQALGPSLHPRHRRYVRTRRRRLVSGLAGMEGPPKKEIIRCAAAPPDPTKGLSESCKILPERVKWKQGTLNPFSF